MRRYNRDESQGRGAQRGRNITAGRGKPDRSDIKRNVGDIVDFLKSKAGFWDSDKIVYEFTGPHGKNWKLITESFDIDSEGKILREIFRLLAHPDIQQNPRATDLYLPLSKNGSLMGIMAYVTTGYLSKEKVARAVSAGRGELKWIDVFNDASCAVETIAALMNKFSAVQSNTMMPLEMISSRIEDLLGKKFAVEKVFDDWGASIDIDVTTKYTNKATNLLSRFNVVQRMQEASTAAKMLAERTSEEKEAGRKRNTILRSRRGVNFVGDPSRDTDFLMTSATPTATDMISSPPTALPQNHVEKEISTDCAAYDESAVSPLPKYPYRSVNHYLNTHYILLREDSIAQMRRGVAALRQLLGEPNEAGIVATPSPDLLRKSCQRIDRLKHDNGARVYGNVKVCNIENTHDGFGYAIKFQTFENRPIDWASSKRFMNGSLLCLSKDGTFNESSLVIATVLTGVKAGMSLQIWINGTIAETFD